MTGLMLCCFVVSLIVGIPIGLSLLLSGTAAIVFASDLPANIVMMNFFRPLTNFTLVAIPFFVMSGVIMMGGRMGREIIKFATLVVGRFRGGLGQVNVLGGTIFGGVSGSAVADASATGAMLIPWMTREGYPASLSAAITASSAVISVLIPPSIPLLIFATISNMSVADLFLAGLIPGLMLAAGLMGTCYVIGRVRHLPIKQVDISLAKVIRVVLATAPALILPVMIVFALRLGVATPTEVSVLAVAYALLVRLLYYRDLSLRMIAASITTTVSTTGVVMLVICASSVVSYVLTADNIPSYVASIAQNHIADRWQIIALMNVAMLVVGMFIDLSAAILLLGPLFVQLAIAINFDLVQLGVMMTLNLAIGLFTPPVGTTLFIAAAISKRSVGEVARQMWPFWLVAGAVLLLVSYVPIITLR